MQGLKHIGSVNFNLGKQNLCIANLKKCNKGYSNLIVNISGGHLYEAEICYLVGHIPSIVTNLSPTV